MKRMVGMGGVLAGVVALGIGAIARADEPAAREQMKLEKQIQANLQNDRDLGNNHIDVRVAEGVATLKGTVDSESERGHAVSLASVQGVRVIDDQLKVGPAGARATIEDGSVTTKVKSQLLASNDLRNADISVAANDGVVTLTGAVASEELRRLAIELAHHTGGVVRVDDQIKVAVPPPVDPRRPTR